MKELIKGLSVVMIAKNASRYLEESLCSLSGVADEIVFIDTGSTDSSVEIAKKHACRIFAFDWCDDFSMAKNFGVEQARCRWIMNIDADEVLDGNGAKAILGEAIRNSSVPAYIIYQDNLCDSGEVKPNMLLRLFQNDPRIRYTNPVHECISEMLLLHWPGFSPPILDVHLKHYGYLSLNIHGKHKRNLALLQRWVNADPDNIFGNYKLGCALFDVGRKGESLICLEKAYELFAVSKDRYTAPFLPVFAVIYHYVLVSAGLPEKAEKFAQIACVWIKALYESCQQRQNINPFLLFHWTRLKLLNCGLDGEFHRFMNLCMTGIKPSAGSKKGLMQAP
jgi:glycosyltransferase involved in cell wall biosynthesis